MISMLAGLGIGLAFADFHEDKSHDTERLARERRPHPVWTVVGFSLILASLALGVLGWNFYRSERRFHLARSLIAEAKFSGALKSLDSAAALMPHSPDLSYWNAFCLLNTGRAGESLIRLDRLVDSRPWDARSQYLLGEAHRLLGHVDSAAEAFRQAHALEPTGRMAVEWANALLAQGKVAEARGILERQLQRAIHPPALRLYLQIQKETGELAAARDFLRSLRNDDSLYFREEDRAALTRWEAELSALLGDRVGAVRAYEDALLLQADDFQLWNDYGLALKRIRQLDHADTAFARASQLNPAHYAPVINRLELALERNDFALARNLANQLRGIYAPHEVRERLDQLDRELDQKEPQTPAR
jgi:Flp pilus assembly protein TadD